MTAVIGFVFQASALAQSAEYRIGVILALSGTSASLGRYLQEGAALAYSELPAPQKERIRLLYEDDQFQPARTVSAYQKLKSTDKINAVLVLGSGSGNAAAPLAERDGTIMIAVGASDFNVVKNRKWVFSHWVTPEIESQVLAAELKRRGYSRIALVTHEHEGAVSCLKALEKEMDKAGLSGRIVLNERYLPSNVDFRTFLFKAKAKQADAIIELLFPGSISALAKQARQMQLKADLVGIELFEDENEVKASDGALLGQWYVNADTADAGFVSAYLRRYNKQPGWGAANAYDSIKLIAQAVEKSGPDNEKIALFLKSVKDYRGAAGVYSASGDNRFDLPATIKIVTAQGFEKLKLPD